ncbi:MAG: DUF4352 domain-containing protein [Lachnospiraceae bacterium]|nr:DUF4352 domain-containing protein [Candidatus Equihabitans merdae]
MRKKSKSLAAVLCLAMFAAMAMGSGSSSSSEPSKVGEVKAESEAVSEEAAAPVEEKTEYHVGDILSANDMEIVYAASGEYVEDNEFMQPADGNKLVFIKLAFENTGSSDTTVSSLLFEGYADGYNVEQHFTGSDLSATLSPGRTTEGVIVFEVPQDAQQIEIEYETNVFTSDKIKFIYDGDVDSGYVQEGNATASETAFVVGDIVESSNLNIAYLSCENDTSYNEYFGPSEGCHFVTLTFEFENKGDKDEIITMWDFDCYAAGKHCEQSYFRDDALDATLSPGRKAQGTVTFEVPDGASVVEAEFVSNIWTSSRVVFTVTE